MNESPRYELLRAKADHAAPPDDNGHAPAINEMELATAYAKVQRAIRSLGEARSELARVLGREL
jgi:hypothetical protein